MAGGRRPGWDRSALVRAVAAVVDGASYAHAEALSGVPSTTLQGYVARHGIVRDSVPRPGRKRAPDAVLGRAVRAMLKGASQAQAAQGAGIGVSTLRAHRPID